MRVLSLVWVGTRTTEYAGTVAFFRDVLEFRAIDIGRGWMIFALPPAEAAVHPGDGQFSETHAGHQMMGALVYLMCDDLQATIKTLAAKNVTCTEVDEAEWGIKTTIPLHLRILSDPEFIAGNISTSFMERFLARPIPGRLAEAV